MRISHIFEKTGGNSMKKITIFILGLSLFFACFIGFEETSAKEKEREAYTFGEIEQILIAFLSKNKYTLEVGTPEFTEFVNNQMQTDADKKLARHTNYDLICAYFGEYLHRLSLFETALVEGNEEPYEKAARSSSSVNPTILEVYDETFTMEELRNTTLGEVKAEILEEEAVAYSEVNESQFTTMAVNTLNLTNARAYAGKYYSSYNYGYPSYSNDCTNFVSQILQAGGKRQVRSTSTAKLVSDTKYWYVKSLPAYNWGRSSSWTVVTDLYSHLIRTQSAYSSSSKSSIISATKSGDVIQFKKSGADRYSHAMWVYEKTSSDLKLSGHTNNYLKRSFNAITGYATYRIVKM